MNTCNENTPPASKSLGLAKKLQYSFIAILLFSITMLAVGEVFVRLTDEGPSDPIPPYDTAQKDALLGWKMTPNYTYAGPILDAAGQPYQVAIHYDKNGFKTFGDPASSRPKVFFVGDSYTASIEASNGQSFFDLLGDSLEIEVFAYGHAGFGTLQEYMILDRWVDSIKPDLVVLETCSNDFIDNHALLERVCGYKVGERRPYLKMDGNVVYQSPLSFWQSSKRYLLVLKWLETRWEGVREKVFHQEKRVGEFYIATQRLDFQPYREAVAITGMIVEKIKARLPEGTKLVAFSADGYQPQLDDMANVFAASGIPFFKEPIWAAEQAAGNKQVVRSFDNCHFNPLGHQLIAAEMLKKLRPLLKN